MSSKKINIHLILLYKKKKKTINFFYNLVAFKISAEIYNFNITNGIDYVILGLERLYAAGWRSNLR